LLVDHHAHWNPPAYLELIRDRDGTPRAELAPDGTWLYTVDEDPFGNLWTWGPSFQDLEENIADMDRNGVEVSLLSAGAVGGDLTTCEIDFAKEACGLLNEEVAAAQARHPERLRGLAMLPLQDTDAAIELLDRAIEELGMAGVCIATNLGGASIAPPHLTPLYRRIEELAVPIVLHPTFRSTVFASSIKGSSEGSVGGRIVDVSLGWVYDTSLAVMTLICNGIFDECPHLTVLHPHTGGVIPFITGRVRAALTVPRTSKEFTLERSIDEYLRTNVYVDFASGSSPTMIELAVQTYGSGHVLFGSDYPFVPRGGYDAILGGLEKNLATEIMSNRLPGIELPAIGEMPSATQ
jgi:aminocarboxymuconate-semialdehyde decarboxylase